MENTMTITEFARLGGKARMAKLSDQERKAMSSMGGKARAAQLTAEQRLQSSLKASRAKQRQQTSSFTPANRPPIVVYGLSDPDSGRIRYVGVTLNRKKRERVHTTFKYRTTNQAFIDWMESLKTAGKKPHFVVLRETNLRDMYKHELEEIKKRSKSGLLNSLGNPSTAQTLHTTAQ